MTDVLDGVRDHYRANGLTERLKTALTAFRTDEQRLTPQQLATLDQFHRVGSSPRASRMSTSCRPDPIRLRAVSANLACCHSRRR